MTSAPPNPGRRLESLLGGSRVLTDPVECAKYAVDEIHPSAVAKPSTAEEVQEIVRFALPERLAIIPCGQRTKLAIGMPPSRYDIAVDMTGINQIAHYDPGDLTLSVDAGANFNNVAFPLYKQKQFLPLSVPYYFKSTIGGIIASGVDSGFRQHYGTARDFLIGAEFVDGTGKLCKSGGRVVKNVSGYDLHKLLIGSLGTLAIITRLNFRTFPVAPASRGFIASFASPADALELLRRVNESPLSPASIEIVSPQFLQIFLEAKRKATDPPAPLLEEKIPRGCWHLCISIDGTSEVCERSVRELTQLARPQGRKIIQFVLLNEEEGADFWHHLGQTIPLLLEISPFDAIFKIVQLPTRLAALLEQLAAIAERANLKHATLARGCGVIYFALLPRATSADTSATLDVETLRDFSQAALSIFELCSREKAAVTLPWCPSALKRQINIWGSFLASSFSSKSTPSDHSHGDVALMSRLKSAFDPQHIFAPGRNGVLP